MKFSLLDRSRTRAGTPDGQALTHTVERAVWAESMGYERFWVAEHHGVPGIASGAPAVLLAAIGARTATIRLGSGGVMLPNHRPLVVAEQFLMLAGLFPGRVDLGVGRSLGFTAPVRQALGRLKKDPDTFVEDVAQVRRHFERTAAITARPVVDAPIPLFVLAMGAGLEVAAELGLPAVLGGPAVAGREVEDLVARYRRNFRSHDGSRPYVVVAVDLLVADSDAEARELALSETWAMAESRRTGLFEALLPVAEVRDRMRSDRLADRVEKHLDTAMAGSPDTVRRRLEKVVEHTGADEVLATGSTFDRAALEASDAAVAQLFR